MRSVLFLAAIFLLNNVDAEIVESCESTIYCQGKLLDIVQMARVFPDQKTFVDMVQKNPLEITWKHFNTLLAETNNTPSRDDIVQFVKDNFETTIEAREVTAWNPPDFKSNPAILDKIEDERVKEFARNLLHVWPKLGRKCNESIRENPDQHSAIYIPNGFFVPTITAGRFQEMHYWDSYWVIKGLLLSEMYETVRGYIENFLYLVKTLGFIPNGTRIYFLNRSQPPLLAKMMRKYVDATGNMTWLAKHVDTLEKEMDWWWKERHIVVNKGGTQYDMFQYADKSNTPRPESYWEDVVSCQNLTGTRQEDCYRNLKSAAESGWDHSCRWMYDENRNVNLNLSDMDLLNVIPVELNALLCRAFEELSRFYHLLGNEEKSQKWIEKHNALKTAIHNVNWNEEDGIWYDFDVIGGKQRKEFYPTNFAPLWAEAYDTKQKETHGNRAAQYYKRLKIDQFSGGIPASLVNSGQQWDMPAAWAPLQDFVIGGLKKTGSKEAEELAISQGKKVLQAYMLGFETTHGMYEKYDVFNTGRRGGGGEYTVQIGFGWSNGEAFQLIHDFFTKSDDKNNKLNPHSSHGRHKEINDNKL